MRRRFVRSNRNLQKRIFECPVCGFITPAAKRRGRTNVGHIKTMFCVRCGVETLHVQID